MTKEEFRLWMIEYINEILEAVRNLRWDKRDWPSENRRRGELVDKEIGGTITSAETAELAALQAYADYYLEKMSPRPTHVLAELENRINPGS